MDTIVVVFLLAIAGFIGFTLGGGNKRKAMQRLSKEREQTDSLTGSVTKLREELGQVRAQITEKEASAENARKDAEKLRQEVKKAKERAHKHEKESETLGAKLAELEGRQQAYAGIDEMREQLMHARTEAANLRVQLDRIGGASTSAPPQSGDAAASTEDDAVLRAALDAQRAEVDRVRASTRDTVRERTGELRRNYEDQLRAERDRVKEEIRSLRGRLSRVLNDVDRERRRAENADRAYAIVKSQLEAELDKVRTIDPSFPRPGAIERPAPAPVVVVAPVASEPKVKRAEAPAPSVVPELATSPKSVPAERQDTPDPLEAALARVATAETPAAETSAAETSAAETPAAETPVEVTPSTAEPATTSTEAASSDGTSDAVSDAASPESTDSPVPSHADAPAAAPVSVDLPQPVDLAEDDDGWDLDDDVLARLTSDHKTVS